MNVLFIASEAEPFVKVGGLADVAGSLPRALENLRLVDQQEAGEIDIRLVLPYHPQIRQEPYTPQPVATFPIPTADGEVLATVFSVEAEGMLAYLVGGEPIDQESGVYSANLEADGYKYVFFSLACLELPKHLGWKADILHANDWHTAAAVYSLALRRPTDPFFQDVASLLTVHNLPYLGSMTPPAMQAFGLPPGEHSDLPSWARTMALPLGLLSADAVVAVSPGYAREILTEEYGSGLADFLKAHASKISGILNGLDTDKWDPATDTHITANFSARDLLPRQANKAYLQQAMGLEVDPRIPVLSMVTRMDPQKGVDLAVEALQSLLKDQSAGNSPVQVIFLGTGNPVLESEARRLERDFPGSVRTRIVFSEPLSHHIYAGADMLLMPSRYEPCGLSQMIAMHYGCVPIARLTGGLSDTIHDPQTSKHSTGFLFPEAKAQALAAAIKRALRVYSNDPAAWQAMQIRGMRQDFSWDRSAQAYYKQYQFLMRQRK